MDMGKFKEALEKTAEEAFKELENEVMEKGAGTFDIHLICKDGFTVKGNVEMNTNLIGTIFATDSFFKAIEVDVNSAEFNLIIEALRDKHKDKHDMGVDELCQYLMS